jgi:hypothetical protein
MIFLRHGFEKPEHIEATEMLADYVSTIEMLGVSLFSIDISIPENKGAITQFLKDRGGMLDETSIDENSFIL